MLERLFGQQRPKEVYETSQESESVIDAQPDITEELPIQSEVETDQIITAVHELVPAPERGAEVEQVVNHDLSGVSPHRVKSTEQVTHEKEAASNPHGFTELK